MLCGSCHQPCDEPRLSGMRALMTENDNSALSAGSRDKATMQLLRGLGVQWGNGSVPIGPKLAVHILRNGGRPLVTSFLFLLRDFVQSRSGLLMQTRRPLHAAFQGQFRELHAMHPLPPHSV